PTPTPPPHTLSLPDALPIFTPAKMSYFKLPSASVIEPVVSEYRKALLRMRDVQDDGSTEGKRLYAMLVEPAKKLIPPGSRVIVLDRKSTRLNSSHGSISYAV